MMSFLTKIKNNKLEKFVYIFSFISLIAISLGKFQRYLFSERLALAFNLEKFGTFYPNINSIYDVYNNSAYFPGGVLLAYALKKITPDIMLFETAHILSAFIIILFFFLVKKILLKTYKEEVNLENYWLTSIVYTLVFCKFWLWYATGFKTDTLVFTLIIFAFLLSNIFEKDYKINIIKLLCSTFLIVFALSIKQQAIFIIPAMVIFSIINKNFFFRIYTVFIIFLTGVLYFYFYKNSFIWFWAIERMGQDALHSIQRLVIIYYKQFFLITSFIFIFSLNNYFKIIETNFSENFKLFKIKLKNNFMFLMLFFFALTGLISGLKDGGNTGNTGLALIMIYPIIYLFLNFLNKNILIIFSIFLLFNFIPNISMNLIEYFKMKTYQNKINYLINEKKIKILGDKSNYFALFTKEKDNEIHFLSTFTEAYVYLNNLQNDKRNPQNRTNALKKNINRNYDYIILSDDFSKDENFKNNFKLIFESKYGNVFKKK